MATHLRCQQAEAMKREQRRSWQPAPGILRAALALGILSGVLSMPLPAQVAIGRPGFTNVPPAKKRTTATASHAGGSDADKRLADAIENLTPKDRKRFNKAMKRLTPEQRAKMMDAMKRQLASTPRAPE